MNLNKKIAIIFISGLLFSCSSHLKQIQESNSVFLNKNDSIQSFETGGSNYVTYNAQNWIDNAKPAIYSANNDPAWNAESFYLTVGELPYNKDLVLIQLKNMYSKGQRKIALPIYFSVFTDVFEDKLFEKHMLKINSGKLNNQQEENLAFLINQIKIIGFNEISIRFMQQWNSDPQGWTHSWNEDTYQKNWSFITNTINVINPYLKNSNIKILYDLGGELGGVNKGQSSQYVKRLWKDYCGLYGKVNTIGFSIAYNKKRLINYQAELNDVGVGLPNEYGIDLYSNLDRIPADIKKIKSLVVDKSVVILETFCDDKENFNEILKSAMKYNLKVRTIYQWPKVKGNPIEHFNLNYCLDYKLAPYIKSTGSTCEDNSCIWINGSFIANENTHVEIIDTKTRELLNTYSSTEITKHNIINNELIILKLKTNREIELFKSNGLRVVVVNSDNGTSSDYGNFKITRR